MAGRVLVDGAWSPRRARRPALRRRWAGQPPRYVSRGGDKLETALGRFGVDVTGEPCLDLGASTGGFTDCLLQHGAARVAAVDVGRASCTNGCGRSPGDGAGRVNARNLACGQLPFSAGLS